MGFKEIAMIVVALILAGILGLSVAPSISASGAATTTSVAANEVQSVASAAKMYMGNTSTAGNFTGITPTAMASYIPNLALSSGKFTSKAYPTGTINVAAGTPATNLTITVTLPTAQNATDLAAALNNQGLTATASTTTVTVTVIG